jgi:cyanate permease
VWPVGSSARTRARAASDRGSRDRAVILAVAWTTLSAQWFPKSQRATAVSLITLSNLVGVGVGMALTPTLVKSMSISSVQLTYGVVALAAGAVFVVVARDRPPTPPEPGTRGAPVLMMVGVRHALRVRPFVVFLALAFVAMGVFNGVSTWVAQIVEPRGFSSAEAGNLGALMLLGGVLGAVGVPPCRTGRNDGCPTWPWRSSSLRLRCCGSRWPAPSRACTPRRSYSGSF